MDWTVGSVDYVTVLALVTLRDFYFLVYYDKDHLNLDHVTST